MFLEHIKNDLKINLIGLFHSKIEGENQFLLF